MAAGANATPGQAPRVDHPAQPAIMALINSLTALNVGGGSGQVGDYVYTPEAFDRILTHLMNSGANGPPPAPREALDALPNKKIDDSMLDDEGKAKCSICMADVREPNDEGIINEYVCELPCKHWFHEDCVKEWLKSHDSCPICRKPIVNHDGNAHAHPAPPSGGPSYGGNGGNGGGNDGAGPSNGGSSYHPPGSFPQDRGDGAGGSSGGNSNGNGGRSNSFFGSWFYRNNSNNSRAQSAQSNDASSRSQQAVQGTSTGGGSQQSMAIFQALRQHRSNVNPGFLTAHNSALNARPTNVGRRAISFVRYPPIHDTDYATNTQAVVEDMEYEGEVDGLPVGGEVTELSEGSVRSESGLGVAGGAGAGAAGPGAVNGCVGALRLVRRVRTRNITSKSSPYARPAASDNAQHGTAEQAYGNAMMRFFRQNGGARRS